MKNKGITRLVFFVVFMIPVAWYLILQLFGSNRFELTFIDKIDPLCGSEASIVVFTKNDSLSVAEQNYMNRVKYGADKRKVAVIARDKDFFTCINQSTADLVLVDEKGLWGSYLLTRDDVDRLLTELDILALQKTYGEGASR